jgi:hypothetical protein
VNGGVFITNDITSPGSAGTYTYNGTAIDYASNGTRYWSWGSGTARGTFDFIQLENDGQNQQTPLSIDSSGNATFAGNVIIGTSATTDAILNVAGNGETTSLLKLKSTHGNGNTYAFKSNGGNAEVLAIMDITAGNRIAALGQSEVSFATTGTTRLLIDSSGLINMGDQAGSGAGRLNLSANPSNNYQIEFFTSAGTSVGTITTSGGTTTNYNTTSDYRLKEDLQDFNGLNKVSKIPIYDFKWKTDESRSYGVMAHELQEVLPQAVVGDKDAEEMQSVDYSKIVPLLVKSIQELKAEVDKLKQECKCKN